MLVLLVLLLVFGNVGIWAAVGADVIGVATIGVDVDVGAAVGAVVGVGVFVLVFCCAVGVFGDGIGAGVDAGVGAGFRFGAGMSVWYRCLDVAVDATTASPLPAQRNRSCVASVRVLSKSALGGVLTRGPYVVDFASMGRPRRLFCLLLPRERRQTYASTFHRKASAVGTHAHGSTIAVIRNPPPQTLWIVVFCLQQRLWQII